MAMADVDQEVARELLTCAGQWSAYLNNFALDHVPDEIKRELLDLTERAGFQLAVIVDIAPAFRVRMVAAADGHKPLTVFELKPTPVPN